MSSGEVDLATLAIKVDVTDIRGAITELNKLEQSAVNLQAKAESVKTFFAGLGQAVNSSYSTIDSTLNNHLASAINKEKTYTTAFDSELKAREIKSLQSSDRRLSQILELQVKISNKERQLQEQSLASEKAHNDRRIILTAKTLNEIEALERAKAEKVTTKATSRTDAVNAYKAETATLLAEFERRTNLEQSILTRGENTKATIRLKYAQQEEMIRARLANAIKEVTSAMESGLISKTEALAARESILARASEELINTNKGLVDSLHKASDATDIFHRVLSKSLDMLIRMAAYRAISIIASMPGQIFEVNKDFELLRIRLEGVMGSAEAAGLELKRLQELDLKTPFDLKSLADADLMLRNFGLELNDAQFKGLTDQIAQLGVGSEGLTGIVTQLGQAWAKNRLQLTDLRPMMERHLPVLDLLAKSYGKNVNEILAMASAGELGREAILKLFDEMERNAPDAAAKQMHLLSGAMSNVTSVWEQFLDSLLGPRLEKFIAMILEFSTTFLVFGRDLLNGDLILAFAAINDHTAKFIEMLSFILEPKNLDGSDSFLLAISKGFQKGADDLRDVDKQRRAQEVAAMAQADKDRTAKQAAEMELLDEAMAKQTSGNTKITSLEKELNKFKLDNYKSEIDAIKDVEKAKLAALDSERSALDSQLEHNKISIQEYYKEQLRLINEVTSAKSKSIDEQIRAEEKFQATQTISPVKGSFASIIAGAESGGAGYDAYNKGKAGDTTVAKQKADNISSLTIGEILARQALNASDADNLGAVGKYQVIEKTLRAAVSTLKLTADTKYDAATQEKIFSEYLLGINKQPEFYNFIVGKTKDLSAAMNAAAAEFASLKGAGGKGNYDGDGAGNKGTVETKNAILEVKSLYDQAVKSGLNSKDAFTLALNGQVELIGERLKGQQDLSKLTSEQGKVEAAGLNKTLELSRSTLDMQEKQTQAIAAQELKVKQLTTSEADLVNVRKNAQAAANLELEKNSAYQQAKISGDSKGAAAFEAEARLKVEKTVADAEIKLVNDVRDQKLNAIEKARTALDVSLGRNEISNEQYAANAKDLIQQELAIRINALDVVNEKYKTIGIPFADFDKDRLALAAEAKAKELAVTNAAITNSEVYQQELAKEDLALFKLSHTAEEVAKKERELYFLFDKNYKAALARDKALGTKDAPKLAANQDAIVNDKTKKADFDHLQRLIDINKSYKEIGINASEAFDIVAQGTGAVVTAFDGFIKALDNISVKLQQNSKDFKQLEADKATLGDTKYQEQLAALTEKQTTLEYQKTQATLQGTAQMLGAAKHLFKEQSAGYKALAAAEKVYRAIEIANALSMFFFKQDLTTKFAFVDKAAKLLGVTTEQATVAPTIAASQAKGMAKAAEGVATQGSAGPYIGFALMAAMAALMAGLGFAVGGGAGTDINISQDRQDAQGAGTILGDVTAKTNSIAESLELIRDTDLTMLPLTGQMARSLSNIENSIAGLGNLVAGSIYNGGNGPKVEGLGKTSNFSDPFDFLGNMFGLGDLLFGSTKRTLEDYGLFIKQQSLKQIMDIGLMISQYTTIKEESSAFFGLFSSTDISNQLSNVDAQTTDQFTKIILNIVDSVDTATKGLGLKGSEFKKRLDSIVLDIGFVSLKGLKGQELQDALQGVFSKAADQIAQAAFPGLIQFQKVGEGYFQTLIRVSTGTEQATAALASLNVKAISYTAIINKQGDVFAEIVKQSIVAIEQQNGIVNSVGTIISTLQGTGQDIVDTYKELLEIRNLIVASKLKASALSPEMIQGAGGVSALKDSLSVYNDKYFTDAEKLAAKTKELVLEFAGLGYIMPKTKEDFKKLVQGIDTSSAAGKLLLGQVLKLADGFDSLKEQQTDYLDTLKDNISDAYDTAKNLLQKQIDVYSTFIKNMKNLSESLLTGNSTILSNPQVYQHLKGEVSKYSNLLTTGTDAQKQDARDKLPGLIQQFLDSSKKYNASGLGYVKDFMSMQDLIASSIKDATKEKDVYQKQLDQLTAQVKALGLIKASVDNVKDAVKAVTVAINALKAFQVAQAEQTGSQKELSNKAAFNSFSNQKLANYNTAISKGSSANMGVGQNLETFQTGFDADMSKKKFGASGTFNANTGATVGSIATMSESKYSANVQSDLKTKLFPLMATALSSIGTHLKSIVGGTLPSVGLKFGDNQEYGPGYMEYSFAGKKHLINSDNMVEFERAFAKDMSSYLISQMKNKEWANKLLKVQFPTLGQGFADLFQMMFKLKNPYTKPVYNPNTNYVNAINGSHKSGLTNVPFDGYVAELHKNERVLTSDEASAYNQMSLGKKSNSGNNECAEIKEELIKIRKQNSEQLQIIKNTNAVEKQGFNEIIMNLKQQLNEMAANNRANARVVRER